MDDFASAGLIDENRLRMVNPLFIKFLILKLNFDLHSEFPKKRLLKTTDALADLNLGEGVHHVRALSSVLIHSDLISNFIF